MANVGPLEPASTSRNITTLYQAIQQDSSILEGIDAMLEQAAISGNNLHPAIKHNSSILEEINALLEQTATFKNMNMLYGAIQQNPSILEEVNIMLEQAATFGNSNKFYQAIRQNSSILEVVNAMVVRAATLGNINMLYRAIQQNPNILEEIDAIPFVNTPLHIAASAGHMEFAIEIMGLKPSFGFKLNPQGLSPIHVALHNNHYSLVDRLVEINKDLVRVKGKERLTPLHLLCLSGSEENIRLLTHFLDICPDSIKDVNVRKETALHIALRCGNLSALEKMVDWLKENTFKGADDLERSILNRTTVDGNNILHLATICRNTQAVMLLIGSKKMEKNAKNSWNQTALDLAIANSYPEIERILEGAKAKRGEATNHGGHPNLMKAGVVFVKALLVFQRKMIRPIRRLRSSIISSQQRETYMVVAALIVTAVYQTALSPPGGLYQPDNNLNSTTSSFSLNATNTATMPRIAGKASMKASDFIDISVMNALILYLATMMIFIVMPDGIIGYVLGSAVMSLALSYVQSIILISPTGKGFINSFRVSCYVLLFFLFMWIPHPFRNPGLVA